MKKILNERLQKLSAYIYDNEKVIDIGCDHGLLGIYLVLNRNNISVISSDINEKPLIKAKENALKYHVLDKIKIKCSDGLNAIDIDTSTIVISGMGSISIVNILKDVNNYPNIKKLVLSPNNDFDYLRYEISKLGFKINKEEMVYDKGKFYLIIEFIKGKDNVDYFFGKLDLDNEINRKYFLSRYSKNKEIINKLNNNLDKRKLEEENNKILKKLRIN